jgi:hypothetical protein
MNREKIKITIGIATVFIFLVAGYIMFGMYLARSYVSLDVAEDPGIISSPDPLPSLEVTQLEALNKIPPMTEAERQEMIKLLDNSGINQ